MEKGKPNFSVFEPIFEFTLELDVCQGAQKCVIVGIGHLLKYYFLENNNVLNCLDIDKRRSCVKKKAGHPYGFAEVQSPSIGPFCNPEYVIRKQTLGGEG